MTKKKFFIAIMGFALIALLSCSKEDPAGSGGTGSISIRAKTDMGVKPIVTKAEETDTYLLYLNDEHKGALSEHTTITDLTPGSYTVKLISTDDLTLPAFDKPIYSDEVTQDVQAGERRRFELTCTQENVGIKFSLGENITTFYPNLVVNMVDSEDSEKTISYDYKSHEGKIIYFAAKTTVRISLKNDGSTILIGGNEYAEITTNTQEVWTITLNTNEETTGNISVSATVDKTVTDQEADFEIGDIQGAGTFASPYLTASAIIKASEEPQSVWVKGVVVGTANITTRAADATYYLIGKDQSTAENKCIVAVVPAGSSFTLTTGATVLIQGNLKKESNSFISSAAAVIEGITEVSSAKTLKDFDFPVGFAVKNGAPLNDAASGYTQILKANARRLSGENSMKPEEIWKGDNLYDFTKADALVKFAKANGMKVHGHTLLWPAANRTPGWLKQIPAGSKTKEEWIALLEGYITKVVTHFKGQVDSWDVVNEAFGYHEVLNGTYYKTAEKFPNGYDFWIDRIGEEYFEIAFKAAHKADPDAILFYNDTDLEYGNYSGSQSKPENGERRTKIYAKLTEMRKAGMPIHGTGIQFHIDQWYSNNHTAASAMEIASNFGLVHISELDVRLDGSNPQTDRQNNQYTTVFNAFMNNVDKKNQFGITIWGVEDSDSPWLTDYPNSNPLLFNKDADNNYHPKETYKALIGLLD